ncbi:MAG TPA: uroporphyrinogen-III synthase [Bacteroidales bacterium]|nr:uroporphyrinogen-III synthase [Bacteroidales bacterium]HRZ20031.1 uroporphyrinogen-III synthase [Bacteroidales bacterium]
MKVKNILVTQPQPSELDKSPYGQLAKKHNVTIDFIKFIQIEGITAKEFRQSKVHILDYSAVIFTSRNAVDHFFHLAKELRIDIPDDMKYFCISEATAFYLQKYIQYRKRKIFYSKQNFVDLLEIIKKHKEEKYLLPCSDVHKQEITKLLQESNIQYTKAVIYKTLASDLKDINIDKYDLLVFFSPSGVKSLIKNFPDFKQGERLIGAFGPTTTKAVRDAGLTLNINAPTKTAPSMTMAIEEFLEKNNKKK